MLNYIIPFFLLISGLGQNGLADHEFHASKCMVDYSEQDQALQVSLHLFIDDLEEALRQQGADKLYICSDKESPKAEEYLFRYLQQHFMVQIDGQKGTFDFIGKEPSEDLVAVWCYFEVPNLKSLKTLEITNNLLMEIFDDQKNIVHITGPGKQKGFFLFQKGKSTDMVEFQ